MVDLIPCFIIGLRTIRSWGYVGTMSLRHLYMRIATLKTILNLTGNQYSSIKHPSVVSVSSCTTSPAIVFCTFLCILLMPQSGSPMRRLLALSKCEMISPSAMVCTASLVNICLISFSSCRFHQAILNWSWCGFWNSNDYQSMYLGILYICSIGLVLH